MGAHCAGTTLAVYYLGAIPFVLGLLHFWAEHEPQPLWRANI